jgi:cobalt/nickel transport system ATP-binding protein
MPDIFELQNIGYQYIESQPALHNINLTVQQGEILSIIGANGCGKSTLLHILCGLVFANEGTIFFKNNQINEQSLKNQTFNRTFRSSIGYVFQNSDAQLFCPTVFDELIFGPLQLGYSKEDAFVRAESVLQMFNITELRNRPPYMLSGGEKKRVAIAAILTSNPEVIVFDEPMSGLDPKTRSFIIELIFGLNEAGKTIIIATHHLELVNHFQSRVVVLSEKHTLEKTGGCDEILNDTNLLVKTNLIGEYLHKHDGTAHKHLSTEFLFYKHRH